MDSSATIDGIDVLAIYIALEVRKRSNSAVWPYIKILPLSYPTVLESWPDKYVSLMPLDMKQAYKGEFACSISKFWQKSNKFRNSYKKCKPEKKHIFLF